MPILWVLVRYSDGRREPEAFLCTDTSAAPRDVLDWFNRRRVEAVKIEGKSMLRPSSNNSAPRRSWISRMYTRLE